MTDTGSGIGANETTAMIEVEVVADVGTDASASAEIDADVPADAAPSDGIPSPGCVLQLDTTIHTFVNASAAKPPTACLPFGNIGNAKCTFQSAALDPPNPQYQIQQNESAKVGDFIDAAGTGNNPTTNPKKLNVCVRYSPDNTPDNEDVTLVIQSTDKGSPAVKVSITAVTETGSWDVKCINPKGILAFDFAGVESGTKESKCILHNSGPAALAINDPSVFEVVANNPGKQAEAEAAFSTKIAKLDLTGAAQILVGANALAPGKEWQLIVVYKVPAQGKPPAASTLFWFKQANTFKSFPLPIYPPDCDAPEPALAPRPELSLHAKFGASDKARIAIANQGCGSLWIQQLCTTTGGLVNPAAPCDKGASKHFKVAGQAQNVTILPGVLQTFEVEFKPENDSKLAQYDLLHVVYCPGKFAGGKCDTALAAETLNLAGSLQNIARPTFKPALKQTGSGPPATNTSVLVSGKYDKGACPYDGKRSYRWLLTGRPGSSLAWIGADSQGTEIDEVSFLPDKPGDYEITAQVQVLDQKDENKFVWSVQDKVTIAVQ